MRIEILLAPIVSDFVGLEGPFPFSRRRAPDEPPDIPDDDEDSPLPNMLWRTSAPGERWTRLLMFAEAHREESGRKIATKVRTLEDMAGKSTKYCKIEKIAR